MASVLLGIDPWYWLSIDPRHWSGAIAHCTGHVRPILIIGERGLVRVFFLFPHPICVLLVESPEGTRFPQEEFVRGFRLESRHDSGSPFRWLD